MVNGVNGLGWVENGVRGLGWVVNWSWDGC